MKKFLLFLIIALLVTCIICFAIGYVEYGIGAGVVFMIVGMATANVYSQKNQEYLHNKWHEDYVRRNKR
ncbi:hypothetical protein ACW2QC_01940 [Virgibacillus sp. FSP13]